MSTAAKEQAAWVYAYAMSNYANGWDYVVECYSVADIADEIESVGFGEYWEQINNFLECRAESRAAAWAGADPVDKPADLRGDKA